MAESITLDNPSKTSGNKESWTESKPVKVVMGVVGLAIGTAIVPHKSHAVTYAYAGILGGAVGYIALNAIFEFDANYNWGDGNAELKGNIEGIVVGSLLAMGMISMRDERLSVNKKLMIATGMGSLLGFNIVRSEFIGRYPDWANWVGAVGGGVAGAGILYGINKIKK